MYRQNICPEIFERGCKAYMAFLDMEKAYDHVDKWEVLQMYVVGVKLAAERY